MHIADPNTGNLGANGIVGGGIPMAVGSALAFSIRGERRVAAVFFSDGAVNNGVFGESLNLAAIWDLPVLFVIENNQYAATTPIETVCRSPDLHSRAAGFGVKAAQVDGNDVETVHREALDAVALCRAGKGPFLLEAMTYRHMGHHVNDPGAYMPAEKLAYFKSQKDPVLMERAALAQRMPEEEIRELERAAEREMEEAIDFAKGSPEPDLEEFIREAGRYT